MTRAMLVERVWGYEFAPTTNIVDVYVRHLRVKLTAAGGEDPIVTVRGVGYMMRG
jgi:two-component system OmpR family response regulator